MVIFFLATKRQVKQQYVRINLMEAIYSQVLLRTGHLMSQLTLLCVITGTVWYENILGIIQDNGLILGFLGCSTAGLRLHSSPFLVTLFFPSH